MLEHIPDNAPEDFVDVDDEDIKASDIIRAKSRTVVRGLALGEIGEHQIDITEGKKSEARVYTDVAIGEARNTKERKENAIAVMDLGTLAYTSMLIDTHDWDYMSRVSNIRDYVVHRLVAEADPKASGNRATDRLKALDLLGRVNGVDLFIQKSQVTNINLSPEEVEQKLVEKLEKLEAIDVETVRINPK